VVTQLLFSLVFVPYKVPYKKSITISLARLKTKSERITLIRTSSQVI